MRTVLLLSLFCSSAVLATPAVLQMLQLGGSSDKSTSPWHLNHHFLGHHFNGSLQANITLLSTEGGVEEWQVGVLHGADHQDREWEYSVSCQRTKVEQESDALAQPIHEELQFNLATLRYFNRQSETFEEEEPWVLKKIGASGKKKGMKKVQTAKRTVEPFPPQQRSFLFTRAVTLAQRNGGGVPEGTPTVLYGSTLDVSSGSDQALVPIQLSLENSQHVPEARSLSLLVGVPENLEAPSADDDDEGEGGTRRRTSESASPLNSRQLLKDKVEMYVFSGTSVRQEQGFFASSNFMLIMMLGFFGFRTWSSFKDARKKIEMEAAKRK